MSKKKTTWSLLLLRTKLESQKRFEVPGSLKHGGGKYQEKRKGQKQIMEYMTGYTANSQQTKQIAC